MQSPPSDYSYDRSRMWVFGRVAGLVLLSAASVWLSPLSIAAIVVVLIVALSLPRLPKRDSRLAWAGVVTSAILCTAGLTRFAMNQAMAGIAEGGQRAAGKSAIWRLREVMLAEDGLRKEARWDPDGDGVGSAALIGALAGVHPLRDQQPLTQPLLNYRFKEVVETRIGPAIRVAGHLVLVCLPRRDGGWTARPGEPVDDELAERRFLAYAWPDDVGVDVDSTFYIDEHDRIGVWAGPPDAFRGGARPPECDSAVSAAKSQWRSWREKQPRSKLPGDR